MGQESVKLLLARRPPEVFQIPLRKGFMPATVHGNPPDSIVMARPLAGLPSTTSPTSRTAVQWSLPPEHHAERGNRVSPKLKLEGPSAVPVPRPA